MLLDESLLSSPAIADDLAASPLSGTTTRGLYSPRQFILRLREDVHQLIFSMEEGIHARAISDEQLMAFSTYLHETIHWWQHVGTNFGLISSLKFPAQSHANYAYLKNILQEEGAFKSILQYEKMNKGSTNISIVVNNWYDIELASQIAFDPVRAKQIVKDPFFDSLGHSYEILWGSAIASLAATIDQDFAVLPDIRKWEEGFAKLREEKVEGFYFGSPMHIAPLGTKAIFEGQARFSQLQYLFNTSGGSISLNDFEKAGLLKGVYGEAFHLFLSILQEQMPVAADDSLVGLFLLISDMAMNPTNGFPFDISTYEAFIYSNDPGVRFYLLCHTIAVKQPSLKQAIKAYSKEEYTAICQTLADELKWLNPVTGVEHIRQWMATSPKIKQLLAEEEMYSYQPLNQPISLFFSKFLVFQRDKSIYPQFFCWPGMNMVDVYGNTVGLPVAWDLFDRHKALFIDDSKGDIYHSAHKKHSGELLDKNLNDFFMWHSVYDLTSQWIAVGGKFKYNFGWLSGKFGAAEIKQWADRNFESAFAVRPGDFRIL